MARLVLAGHDPGGANVLTAMAEPLRAAGHDLSFWAAGPAARSWRQRGWEVADTLGRGDLLLAATGMRRWEQESWEEAGRRGMPSVGVVDARLNLRPRFTRPDGTPTRPDCAFVPDPASRDDLIADGWAADTVAIVGQPHLEQVGKTLKAARAGRVRGNPPLVAFVSEPVIEDFPDGRRGIDQYHIFTALVGAMRAAGPARLLLCLHPREDESNWHAVLTALGPGPEVTHEGGLALLTRADAIIGMTSSMIIEAALGGIPVLSIQPERKDAGSPAIDRLTRVVFSWDELPGRVDHLLKTPGPAPLPAWLIEETENSAPRFLAALESRLGTKY